jgi:hypothetical protein
MKVYEIHENDRLRPARARAQPEFDAPASAARDEITIARRCFHHHEAMLDEI